MPENIRKDLLEAIPISGEFSDRVEALKGETGGDPSRVQKIQGLRRRWNAHLDSIQARSSSPKEWWDAVSESYPQLLRVRTILIHEYMSLKHELEDAGVSIPKPEHEVLAASGDEAVEMWGAAEQLSSFTINRLEEWIEAESSQQVESHPELLGDEDYLPVASKLLWAATLRDTFADLLQRVFKDERHLMEIPEFAEWLMVGSYLMAKQQYYVLRDLGVDMNGAPEEERGAELQRIQRVYDLAKRVERPLHQRVGTFERPIIGFEYLVRRWDKDTDEPFVKSCGLRARILQQNSERGMSASDLAEIHDVPVEAVEEAQRFFHEER